MRATILRICYIERLYKILDCVKEDKTILGTVKGVKDRKKCILGAFNRTGLCRGTAASGRTAKRLFRAVPGVLKGVLRGG